MRYQPRVSALFASLPLLLAPAGGEAGDYAMPPPSAAALGNAKLLQGLVGEWEGTAQTWFEPGKLEDDSAVRGRIELLDGGPLLRHSYTGSMQGKPRRGEETLAYDKVGERYQVVWRDSFHMSYALLLSEGSPSPHGFTVQGRYSAGKDQPDWHWKTVYELTDADHLVITAYNIPPGEPEGKAVETRYVRVKG